MFDSNICNRKSGICNAKQPGCKRGYIGDDCGKCDMESGYGNSTNGKCDTCIPGFYDSDLTNGAGRPNCQGWYFW